MYCLTAFTCCHVQTDAMNSVVCGVLSRIGAKLIRA